MSSWLFRMRAKSAANFLCHHIPPSLAKAAQRCGEMYKAPRMIWHVESSVRECRCRRHGVADWIRLDKDGETQIRCTVRCLVEVGVGADSRGGEWSATLRTPVSHLCMPGIGFEYSERQISQGTLLAALIMLSFILCVYSDMLNVLIHRRLLVPLYPVFNRLLCLGLVGFAS